MLKKITLAVAAAALLVGSSLAPAEAAPSPYERMVGDLTALEQYAGEFRTANPSGDTVDQLVLVYVRTGRPNYATGNWTLLGGPRNPAFEAFVADRDVANGTTAGALKTLDELVLPNGEITDAIHMFATMNLSLGSGVASADLGGWAGDTTDLLTEIRTATGDAAALETLAASRFRTSASSFSQPDVNGDLDALNLMALRRAAPATPYADILSGYFEALTGADRVRDFLGNRFPAAPLTRDGIRAAVSAAYNSNVYITTPVFGLEAQRGITSAHATHRVAAINAFADYLFDTLPIPVSGVTLDVSTVSLLVGDTAQLRANVAPADATNLAVTWSSSDPAVASVDASGAVTAVARGGVTITATSTDGGLTASATVTVRTLPAFATAPTDTVVAAGESARLFAEVADAAGVTMQWEVLAPGGDTWVAISGAVDASYTVPATEVGTGAQYRLVIANDAGSVVSGAVRATARETNATDGGSDAGSDGGSDGGSGHAAPAAPHTDSQTLASSGLAGIGSAVAASLLLLGAGCWLMVARRRSRAGDANVRGT